MQSTPSKVADFEEWMRSVGIKWNSDAITITDANAASTASTPLVLCSGLALGITAARDIKEGDEICQILPKSACICPLTCSIADILEKEELNSGLGLVIAVMHEASLGPDSTWAGYFAAMPQREYLPVFWEKEELAALKGTEIEFSTEEDLANVADDYATHVVPLLSTYPDRFRADLCTLHHFHYAASLVASRMFGIDDVHGAGMVPLADVFNHKASVVDLAPGYAVHGMSDSDSEENEESEEDVEERSEDGGSVDDDDEEEAEGEKKEHHNHDHSNHHHDDAPKAGTRHTIMRRNISTSVGANTTAAVPALHGISKVNGLHLALEIAILDGGDYLQIVAASDIPAGNEIHNTYGELGNDVLVKKYGFALRYNPFNAVQLKKDDVINACKELYFRELEENEGSEPAAKKTKRRGGSGEAQKKKTKKLSSYAEKVFNKLLKILENETDLLTEEDGEEPFELLPNGHIGPALFATLRVLCSGAEDIGNAVTCLDDALTIPSEGKEGGVENGGTAKNVVLDPGSIRAVQIYPVTNEEGKLLNEKELNEAEAAAKAAAYKKRDDSNFNAGNINSYYTSYASSMVTDAMCCALRAAVDQRMAKYPTRLDGTVHQLEKFESELDRNIALNEGQSARRAAFTLRLSEQEIVTGVYDAATIRLCQH